MSNPAQRRSNELQKQAQLSAQIKVWQKEVARLKERGATDAYAAAVKKLRRLNKEYQDLLHPPNQKRK
jgi:hypothetical protein